MTPSKSPPITLLVTASRNWADVETINRVLTDQLAIYGGTVLVHGNCPTGGDEIADRWGSERRLEGRAVSINRHPADWNRHGKSAGFKRNAEMVNYLTLIRNIGLPVLVVAFILNASRGASHTLRLAESVGLPTRVFRVDTVNARPRPKSAS